MRPSSRSEQSGITAAEGKQTFISDIVDNLEHEGLVTQMCPVGDQVLAMQMCGGLRQAGNNGLDWGDRAGNCTLLYGYPGQNSLTHVGLLQANQCGLSAKVMSGGYWEGGQHVDNTSYCGVKLWSSFWLSLSLFTWSKCSTSFSIALKCRA